MTTIMTMMETMAVVFWLTAITSQKLKDEKMNKTIINLRSTTFTSWKAGQPKGSSREVQDCVGRSHCFDRDCDNDDDDEEVEDGVGGKIPLLTTLTVASLIRKLLRWDDIGCS